MLDTIDALEDFLQAAAAAWCEQLRVEFEEGILEVYTLDQLKSHLVENPDLLILP